MYVIRCLLLVVISVLSYANSPISPIPTETNQQILAYSIAPTPVLEDLNELINVIGGRPTGSEAMTKAVNWSRDKFNRAGLENVHLENYSPERNWLPNTELGEISFYDSKQHKITHSSLRVAAMPFSPSTPPAGLKAQVYNVGTGSAKEFAMAGNALKGKWVLVHTPLRRSIDDMLNEYLIKAPIVTRAHEMGAIGVLWLSARPGTLLYRHNLTFNGTLGFFPAAVIEREGGERMIRLLASHQKVEFKLTLNTIIQEKPVNQNVVAEIKGKEKPDEIVILGAHLDSWDLGRGALDNGCNVAMIIDVARQLMKLAKAGQRPQRTLRFILFSGEEEGLYGSWYYVKNHQRELDKIKSVLIFDLGSGRTTGFSLAGRTDMTDIIHHALAPINSLGSFKQTFDLGVDTDNFDYFLAGIPTIVANQDPKPYLADYHAETDTMDKVDHRELKLNTAIAAILLWNFANEEQLSRPRLSRSAVIALLNSTDAVKQMKLFEIWRGFLAGQRGTAIN